MHWLAFAFLALAALWLSWQDFKTRLLSLWLIVAFATANALFSVETYWWLGLLENALVCLAYLLLLYLCLQLYFYMKHRRFQKIIDTQLGLGDVLVLFAIGLGLEPALMIWFFSLGFAVSLLISLWLFAKAQSIPLAGLMALNYLIFLVARNLW